MKMDDRQFETKPDFDGVAKCWLANLDTPDPRAAVNIRMYIVRGPYHPLWNWWIIACVSLREIEGMPSPQKHYPEAEYEIMFLSISPEDAQPDPDKPFPQDFQYLMPPDLIFQFDGVTDEQAGEMLDACAKAISGGMSCDSDFRGWWEGSLKTTLQHYRKGLH